MTTSDVYIRMSEAPGPTAEDAAGSEGASAGASTSRMDGKGAIPGMGPKTADADKARVRAGKGSSGELVEAVGSDAEAFDFITTSIVSAISLASALLRWAVHTGGYSRGLSKSPEAELAFGGICSLGWPRWLSRRGLLVSRGGTQKAQV